MKKTLVALAVAGIVAAPAAFADVTISGQVKVTVANTDDNKTGEWGPGFDNYIYFKASEDLGNGMSAFAEMGFDTDSAPEDKDGNPVSGTSANSASKDQKVGLKGGFGTVVVGRMETLMEGALSSRFDDGMSNHANDNQLESSITNIGRVNALAYVSPSFNGFHVAAATTLDGSEQGISEHIDLLAAYDNGPISIAAGYTMLDDDNGDDSADGSEEDKGQDRMGVAGSYTMGPAKVSLGYFSVDVDKGEEDTSDIIARLDYKFGNNSILVGYKSTEDKGASGEDVTSLKFTHHFSKRTAAWIGYRDKELDDANVTHFGLVHKF